MPMKCFYSFTDPKTKEVLFLCTALTPSEAKEKYDQYRAGVISGKRKRERFNLAERVPGETQDEYIARRKTLNTFSGGNRAERRANIKAIGRILHK